MNYIIEVYIWNQAGKNNSVISSMETLFSKYHIPVPDTWRVQ